MGKQAKGKGNGAKTPITGRPQPYGKKPKVEVKFEGAQPAKSSKPAPPSQPTKSKQSQPQADSSSSVSAKDKGKSKASEAVPALTPGSFIVVAGSYEKLLYGIEGTYAPGAETPSFKPIFIFPAHLACVKAVAASPGGKWLATGSEDEFVKVWDLRRRKEVGSLSQHTGSITSLHFPSSSHLLTSSEDATLSLFRTSDWALLKSLKGHSGRVNHVDVHPTGRVALSVGKDQTLKMWDLMRGRGAASLPLGTEAEMVKFSPLGTHFAVLYPKKVEIYSLTLKLLKTITGPARFNTLVFATIPVDEDEDMEVICVGNEKGLIEVYTLEIAGEEEEEEEEEDEDEDEAESSKKESGAQVERIGTFGGHTNRVKSISALPFTTPSSASHPARKVVLVSSVSSDGFVHLYDLTALVSSEQSENVQPIGKYDTKGSRLTVCFIAEGKKAGQMVKSLSGSGATEEDVSDEDEDDEDEEDEEAAALYDSAVEDEEDEDEMEVEFEDEEEEDEEEGEEE